MSDVGMKLKKIRHENKLTQVELAKKLKVSQSYISGIETGIEKPNNRFLLLISLVYKVPYDWLIGKCEG